MASTRTEYKVAEMGVVAFNDTWIGDQAENITLSISEEFADKKPGNVIYSTGGTRILQEYELSMTIHKVRPTQLALLRGFAASQYQTGTMDAETTSGNVPKVATKAALGDSAGAGFDHGAGVITSTIKLYNADFQEISGGAYAFSDSDYTTVVTTTYYTGSLVSANASPFLIRYDVKDAAARRVNFGGNNGLYYAELKIALMTDTSNASGRGLIAYRANPRISEIAVKGSRESEGDTITVTFKLYGDPSRSMGDNIFRIVEGDF